MPSAAQTYANAIRPLLRTGPAKAQALAQALKVSQPTVSRALSALGDEVVPFGAERSIQYTLRDPPRAGLEAAVYRVTLQFALETLGTLVPVRPPGFVMIEAGRVRMHSDGLPWWVYDMRPQGYLGRAYCQRHGQRLGLRLCIPGVLHPIEPGQVNVQHLAVEEQQRSMPCVRGRRHPPLVDQHGQKTLDLLLPHVSRMPQTVPFHKHAHPLHVCLFSAQAIVFITNSLTDLIK